MADFLCVLEADPRDGEALRSWLDEGKERRLLLVNSAVEIEHFQVKRLVLESPLQIEPLAKKTAWEAVFMQMEIRGGKSEDCRLFRKELERAHMAANLLLSDAADWGSSLAKHAFARKNRLVRQGIGLSGSFKNVPAIIVGAGPSLAKNGHLLELFRNKALLFAGGSALNALETEPHFAAAIDKEASYPDFKRHRFWETPFCFQSRLNPDLLSLVHGESILFPDSHFEFLEEGERFDGGWTVGTFLVSLATLMGCDPIVFVGMDYCYAGGRKYVGGGEVREEHLVEAVARDGSRVWTQPDWLMARGWLEEWASRHPGQRFLNATEGGLGFALPIEEGALASLQLENQADLRERVQGAVFALPFAAPMNWERWKESLERCKKIAESALFGGEEDFMEEKAYGALLLPLWRLWSPVFTRALESDAHPDKIKINRLLFFQQVIEEHLHVIE